MAVDEGSPESKLANMDTSIKVEGDKELAKELQQKAEWLNKKIEEAIAHTRRNKSRNRKRATAVRTAQIAFSGIATILLGLQISGYEPVFKEIAFVLGALVTLLNALEPFFNFRSLWVEHEAAQAKFHRLKDQLEFFITGIDIGKANLEMLYHMNDEYGSIWNTLSETWVQYRREGQKTAVP